MEDESGEPSKWQSVDVRLLIKEEIAAAGRSKERVRWTRALGGQILRLSAMFLLRRDDDNEFDHLLTNQETKTGRRLHTVGAETDANPSIQTGIKDNGLGRSLRKWQALRFRGPIDPPTIGGAALSVRGE